MKLLLHCVSNIWSRFNILNYKSKMYFTLIMTKKNSSEFYPNDFLLQTFLFRLSKNICQNSYFSALSILNETFLIFNFFNILMLVLQFSSFTIDKTIKKHLSRFTFFSSSNLKWNFLISNFFNILMLFLQFWFKIDQIMSDYLEKFHKIKCICNS